MKITAFYSILFIGYCFFLTQCAKSSPSDNNNNTPPPSISGINPSSGKIGSVDTIFGQNFSVVATENTVSYNGTTATITSASATQLIVSIPSGATTGLVKVTTKSGPITGPVFTIMATGEIITVAGTGDYSFSGDGGPALNASFKSPFGIASDKDGNIYVCDNINNRIRKVATDGTISTIAGNGTDGYDGDGDAAINASIGGPTCLNFDGAGNLYFTDGFNNVVRKISTSGFITTVAGNGTAGFKGDGGPAASAELNIPSGVFVAPNGNIYIGDANNFRIRMINSSGIISTVAGDGTTNFSGDGGPAIAAALGFTDGGLTMDHSGNIYITFRTQQRIRKINSAGIISTIAGNGTWSGTSAPNGDNGPAINATLSGSAGIVTDLPGNIYFTDIEEQRIRMINTSGIITTIAGSGLLPGFAGDGGPATAATLSNPWNITLDPLGNIYFTDLGNSRIRKIIK